MRSSCPTVRATDTDSSRGVPDPNPHDRLARRTPFRVLAMALADLWSSSLPPPTTSQLLRLRPPRPCPPLTWRCPRPRRTSLTRAYSGRRAASWHSWGLCLLPPQAEVRLAPAALPSASGDCLSHCAKAQRCCFFLSALFASVPAPHPCPAGCLPDRVDHAALPPPPAVEKAGGVRAANSVLGNHLEVPDVLESGVALLVRRSLLAPPSSLRRQPHLRHCNPDLVPRMHACPTH